MHQQLINNTHHHSNHINVQVKKLSAFLSKWGAFGAKVKSEAEGTMTGIIVTDFAPEKNLFFLKTEGTDLKLTNAQERHY